ncbi:MAG: ABC transporter permease [Bryobacteraceae bacterium]|jgi:putative ABC transport system permease protein
MTAIADLSRCIEDLRMDLRICGRGLMRTPGFTLLAAFPLALGIGSSAAIFSLIYSTLLKPLPYREPNRVVMLWQQEIGGASKRALVTPANFVDWRTENAVFSEIAAFNRGDVKLPGIDRYERVNAAHVTSRFFATLGVMPLAGRTFNATEEVQRGAPTAIISYGLWQRRFQGSASAVGQALPVDDYGLLAYTVIGVMPKGFHFPEGTDIWFPSGYFGWQIPIPPPGANERCCSWLEVVARLKPDVKVTAAHSDMTVIARRIARAHPGQSSPPDVAVVPLREQLIGNYRRLLLLLLAAIACLVLIACANVAGLLFARATVRRNEILIRAALGAERGRIIRQLLAESMLLAMLGAAAGVGLAPIGLRAFALMPGPAFSGAADAHLDLTVLGLTVILTLVVALGSGIAPALAFSGKRLQAGLAQGGRRATSDSAARHFRSGLVVAEFALALGLMTASGLFVRTFDNLQRVSPGFQPQHLSLTTLDFTASAIGDQSRARSLLAELITRVEGLPGVLSAGAVSNAPLTGDTYLDQPITVEGHPARPGTRFDIVNTNAVTPEYFHTMGIPIKAGRALDERDNDTAPLVAVVSETAAKRYWRREDPLGKKFFFDDGRNGSAFHVAGVAGDVLSMGLDSAARPEVYFSYRQYPVYTVALAVRSQGDPGGISEAIARQAAALNKAIVVTRNQRGDELISASIQAQRFRAVVLTIFSGIALLLAAAGMHGVMSYTVAQRTNEIGIRMALGATRSNVVELILRDGVRICLGGLAVGVPVSLLAAYGIRSWIFGVPPFDAVTLAAVMLALSAAAMLACYIPARIAAGLDPVVAIRHE